MNITEIFINSLLFFRIVIITSEIEDKKLQTSQNIYTLKSHSVIFNYIKEQEKPSI